jgi:hypothetical protein
MNNVARLEARITSRSKSRDRSGKRVTDMDEAGRGPYWGWGGNSLLACYRLRAGNIELYENINGWF